MIFNFPNNISWKTWHGKICLWAWLNLGKIIAECCKMCVMSTSSNSLSSAVTTNMFYNSAFNLFFSFKQEIVTQILKPFCVRTFPGRPPEGLPVEEEHCYQCSLKQKLVNIDVFISAFAPVPYFAGQEV